MEAATNAWFLRIATGSKNGALIETAVTQSITFIFCIVTSINGCKNYLCLSISLSHTSKQTNKHTRARHRNKQTHAETHATRRRIIVVSRTCTLPPTALTSRIIAVARVDKLFEEKKTATEPSRMLSDDGFDKNQ